MTWHSSICPTMSWCGGVPLPGSPTNIVEWVSLHTTDGSPKPGSMNSNFLFIFLFVASAPAAKSRARISTAYRRSTEGGFDCSSTVIGRGSSNIRSISSKAKFTQLAIVLLPVATDRNVIPGVTPFRDAMEPLSTSITCAPVAKSQSYGANPSPIGPSGKTTLTVRSETASRASANPASPLASPKVHRPRPGISPVTRPGAEATSFLEPAPRAATRNAAAAAIGVSFFSSAIADARS
mmetsp:Transcript_15920/g.52254  ORF Transcript_15920/g.52254 Transcript_15920/m.52254 type:complete len:237 (+) Transcript_15920:679-1389(+)